MRRTSVGKRRTSIRASGYRAGQRYLSERPPWLGLRDRETGQVSTEVVERTNKATLQDFVICRTEDAATVYTDEHSAYLGLPRRHETVRHSAGEYVRGMASTNGIESHWSLLKRAIDGTFHHVSVKHLHRYTGEFEGRHNSRPMDTRDQMTLVVRKGHGKRLRYDDLTA